MIEVTFDPYTLLLESSEIPLIHDEYVRHARFHDDLGIRGSEGKPAFIAVKGRDASWPHLALSFRHGVYLGFSIGVLIVPETDLLLVGSEGTLLAYDLKVARRLWRDTTMPGFWGWQRHGDVILMLAELELAAYSLRGARLWSTFVEPPWTSTVSGDRLTLDVMGQLSTLSLHRGR